MLSEEAAVAIRTAIKEAGGAEVFFVVTEYCLDGDYRKILDRYAEGWPGPEAIVQDFTQILQGLEHENTILLSLAFGPDAVSIRGALACTTVVTRVSPTIFLPVNAL